MQQAHPKAMIQHQPPAHSSPAPGLGFPKFETSAESIVQCQPQILPPPGLGFENTENSVEQEANLRKLSAILDADSVPSVEERRHPRQIPWVEQDHRTSHTKVKNTGDTNIKIIRPQEIVGTPGQKRHPLYHVVTALVRLRSDQLNVIVRESLQGDVSQLSNTPTEQPDSGDQHDSNGKIVILGRALWVLAILHQIAFEGFGLSCAILAIAVAIAWSTKQTPSTQIVTEPVSIQKPTIQQSTDDERWFAALVRKVNKKSVGSLAKVKQLRHLSSGGTHDTFLLSFEPVQISKNDHRDNPSLIPEQLVVRLRRSEHFNNSVALQVRNEVGVRMLVRERCNKDVPTPRIFAWDAGVISRMPFIAEEYVHGETINDMWANPKTTYQAKMTVVKQLSGILTNLADVRFDMMGGFDPTTSNLTAIVEPCTIRDHRGEYREHYNGGPYKTRKEYMASMFDKEIAILEDAIRRGPAKLDQIGWTNEYIQRCGQPQRFLDYLKAKKERLRENTTLDLKESFAISHGDLAGRNIMVCDGQIMNILDWQWASVQPLHEFPTICGWYREPFNFEAPYSKEPLTEERDGEFKLASAKAECENHHWHSILQSLMRSRMEQRGWSEDEIDLTIGKVAPDSDFAFARGLMQPLLMPEYMDEMEQQLRGNGMEQAKLKPEVESQIVSEVNDDHAQVNEAQENGDNDDIPDGDAKTGNIHDQYQDIRSGGLSVTVEDADDVEEPASGMVDMHEQESFGIDPQETASAPAELAVDLPQPQSTHPVVELEHLSNGSGAQPPQTDSYDTLQATPPAQQNNVAPEPSPAPMTKDHDETNASSGNQDFGSLRPHTTTAQSSTPLATTPPAPVFSGTRLPAMIRFGSEDDAEQQPDFNFTKTLNRELATLPMTESMFAKKGSVEHYGRIFKLHASDQDVEETLVKRARSFVPDGKNEVQTPNIDRASVERAVREHKERQKAEAERLQQLEADKKKEEAERKKKRNAKSKANKKNKKLRKQADAEQADS